MSRRSYEGEDMDSYYEDQRERYYLDEGEEEEEERDILQGKVELIQELKKVIPGILYGDEVGAKWRELDILERDIKRGFRDFPGEREKLKQILRNSKNFNDFIESFDDIMVKLIQLPVTDKEEKKVKIRKILVDFFPSLESFLADKRWDKEKIVGILNAYLARNRINRKILLEPLRIVLERSEMGLPLEVEREIFQFNNPLMARDDRKTKLIVKKGQSEDLSKYPNLKTLIILSGGHVYNVEGVKLTRLEIYSNIDRNSFDPSELIELKISETDIPLWPGRVLPNLRKFQNKIGYREVSRDFLLRTPSLVYLSVYNLEYIVGINLPLQELHGERGFLSYPIDTLKVFSGEGVRDSEILPKTIKSIKFSLGRLEDSYSELEEFEGNADLPVLTRCPKLKRLTLYDHYSDLTSLKKLNLDYLSIILSEDTILDGLKVKHLVINRKLSYIRGPKPPIPNLSNIVGLKRLSIINTSVDTLDFLEGLNLDFIHIAKYTGEDLDALVGIRDVSPAILKRNVDIYKIGIGYRGGEDLEIEEKEGEGYFKTKTRTGAFMGLPPIKTIVGRVAGPTPETTSKYTVPMSSSSRRAMPGRPIEPKSPKSIVTTTLPAIIPTKTLRTTTGTTTTASPIKSIQTREEPLSPREMPRKTTVIPQDASPVVIPSSSIKPLTSRPMSSPLTTPSTTTSTSRPMSSPLTAALTAALTAVPTTTSTTRPMSSPSATTTSTAIRTSPLTSRPMSSTSTTTSTATRTSTLSERRVETREEPSSPREMPRKTTLFSGDSSKVIPSSSIRPMTMTKLSQ